MELITSMGYYSLPFLLVISILVFVHELGHYWVARLNGVRVEVFSIGFGPEIFGFYDSNKTRWKFSLIPLGGYVKMFSDLNAASQPDQDSISQMSEEDKAVSLFHKTVWQRMAVSVAGPAANYLFAILLLGGLYMTVGQKTPSPTARVGIVVENSVAEKAGLKKDDLIIKIDEGAINTFQEAVAVIRSSPEKSLKVTVKRESEILQLTLTPEAKKLPSGTIGQVGMGQDTDLVVHTPFKAAYEGTLDVFRISWHTLKTFGQMISGARGGDDLGGPLMIAKMAGDVAKEGWINLIFMMATLSINLGLINLFPIPMLDGGHLMFYAIEAIRGRPLSDKAQEIGYRIGFVFVITLIVYSTWNDLSHLKIIQFFKNLLGV